MLDRWSKAATIALAVVLIVSAIVAPTIGGVVWLARMNYDVKGLRSGMDELQADVQQLQTDVQQLQTDVRQVQESQQAILDILERLEDDLANHTHGSDGRAQFYQSGLDRVDEENGT